MIGNITLFLVSFDADFKSRRGNCTILIFHIKKDIEEEKSPRDPSSLDYRIIFIILSCSIVVLLFVIFCFFVFGDYDYTNRMTTFVTFSSCQGLVESISLIL